MVLFVYMLPRINSPIELPEIIYILDLALIDYTAYVGYVSRGYQWILLAMMIVTRFILFGKTYQK